MPDGTLMALQVDIADPQQQSEPGKDWPTKKKISWWNWSWELSWDAEVLKEEKSRSS